MKNREMLLIFIKGYNSVIFKFLVFLLTLEVEFIEKGLASLYRVCVMFYLVAYNQTGYNYGGEGPGSEFTGSFMYLSSIIIFGDVNNIIWLSTWCLVRGSYLQGSYIANSQTTTKYHIRATKLIFLLRGWEI
eukprot:snap_masked-scaffold_17-processed-gene-4.23-mRNA-1 protein AED:1.00 eAED:1.00 QI:0/0/0/0/1/1/3/0/131